MFYVLLSLLIISCILYVYFYERITKKQIFIFKVSTSFFLLMFGLYIFYKEKIYESYNLFIILGLFLGFIGDIFLGLRNLFIKYKHLFFVIGIGFFMAGHVAYINAMFMLFKSSVVLLVVLVIMLLLFAIIFTSKTNVKFGKTILICHTYSLLSSIFLSVSLLNAIRLNTLIGFIILFGVINFVLSDFLLSYLYFANLGKTKRKIFKKINIVTYYIAQAILAISIMLI